MKKQTGKDKLTALYERLSHDDERAGESVSIENHHTLPEQLQNGQLLMKYLSVLLRAFVPLPLFTHC